MNRGELALEDRLVNQHCQSNQFVAQLNQVLQAHPEQVFLRGGFLAFGLHRNSLGLQENTLPEFKIRQTNKPYYLTQTQSQSALGEFFRDDHFGGGGLSTQGRAPVTQSLCGRSRPAVMPRRTAKRKLVSVKDLAQSLPYSAFQSISRRESTNERLTGRFATVGVRCAGGYVGKARLLPQQWLLIEWPEEQAEPEKYYRSTLSEPAALDDLVRAAHMRWRIERDHQDLKQDLVLGHYESRG